MPPSLGPYDPPSLCLPSVSRFPHWTWSITIPQEMQTARCESHPLLLSPSNPDGSSTNEPLHQKAHAAGESPIAAPWSKAHSPPYPSQWIRSFPDSSRSNPFARESSEASEIKTSRRTSPQNRPPPPQRTHEKDRSTLYSHLETVPCPR